VAKRSPFDGARRGTHAAAGWPVGLREDEDDAMAGFEQSAERALREGGRSREN
jgi:hypothetical protein